MFGSNEIRINGATMCKALEHWLKTQVLVEGAEAKVVDVSQLVDRGATIFVIKVEGASVA